MQDLVDRLVVVVEEQDVLFTLVVLQEMKETGCLEQAINAVHSWKGYSALQSIYRRPPLSTLHYLIAQLLLLKGASLRIADDQATADRTGVFNKSMSIWESVAQENAQDAIQLASLDIQEAADWIDLNLPVPPNPEKLTGDGPLPPPPFISINDAIPLPSQSTPSPTSSSLSHASKDVILSPVSPTKEIFSPPLHPLPDKPLLHHRTSATSSYGSSASDSSPIFDSEPNLLCPQTEPSLRIQDDDPLVELYLANIPLQFHPAHLYALLFEIGVKVRYLHIHSSSTRKACCFASVPLSCVKQCLKRLNGKVVDGKSLRCKLSVHQTRNPPFKTLLLFGLSVPVAGSLVRRLFEEVGVDIYELSAGTAFTSVVIEASRAEQCITSLHGKEVTRGVHISCTISPFVDGSRSPPESPHCPSSTRAHRALQPARTPPLQYRSPSPPRRHRSPSPYHSHSRAPRRRSRSPQTPPSSRPNDRRRSLSPPSSRTQRRRSFMSPPRHHDDSRSRRYHSPSPQPRPYHHSSHRD